MKPGTEVGELPASSKWYLIVPHVGSVWVWEPDLPHARALVVVTRAKWDGEEWTVWCMELDPRTRQTTGTPAVSNDLSRWVEACVLVKPADEPWPEDVDEVARRWDAERRTNREHNAVLRAQSPQAHEADRDLAALKADLDTARKLSEERRVRLHEANAERDEAIREHSRTRADRDFIREQLGQLRVRLGDMVDINNDQARRLDEQAQRLSKQELELTEARDKVTFAEKMGYELIERLETPRDV